jgi:hypothetical protein
VEEIYRTLARPAASTGRAATHGRRTH